jgi:hypothetical protein
MPKSGRPTNLLLPDGRIKTNPTSQQKFEKLAQDMARFDAYRLRHGGPNASSSIKAYDNWVKIYNAQLRDGAERALSGATQQASCGGWTKARENMYTFLQTLTVPKPAKQKPFSVILQKIELPKHRSF